MIAAFASGNDYRSQPQTFRVGYVAGVADFAMLLLGEGFQRSGIAETCLTPSEWADLLRSMAGTFLGDIPLASLADVLERSFEGRTVGDRPGRLALAEAAFDAGSAFLTLPGRVTLGQLVDTVNLYLTSHPEERHFSAAWLVWKAVTEAFHPAGIGG